MKSWILVLVPSCLALAQQPTDKIAFEVVSVKAAQPSPMGQIRVGMSSDNGLLRYSNVSLRDCIRTAYRVKEFQVEGPDWIESARFDISAKLPAGSTKDQIPEMLQSMLEERFKLALHRETKDHAIYALVAAKSGAKLKPAENPPDDSAAAGRGGPRGGQMQTMQVDPSGVHMKASATTLAGLAEMISRFAERPVVDMTNIPGLYDFELVFSPEAMRGGMHVMGGGPMPQPGGGDRAPVDAPSEGAATIFTVVEKYGLKLEPRKAPMEILVVDRVERTPTEN